MRIILEILDNGDIVSYETDNFDTEVLSNGLTLKATLQGEIAAGENKTGWAQYRKHLEHHKLISANEVQEWRNKLPIEEKELASDVQLT